MCSRCASARLLGSLVAALVAVLLATGCGVDGSTDGDVDDTDSGVAGGLSVSPEGESSRTPSPAYLPSRAASPPGSPVPTSRPAGSVRLIVTAEAGTRAPALAAALEDRFGSDLRVERVFAQTGQLVVTVATTERERVADFPGVAHTQEDTAQAPSG